MTRSHTHTNGKAAANHDRHLPRNAPTSSSVDSGVITRKSAGKHFDSDPVADLPLARKFGDSNFASVEDPEELDRACHTMNAARKQSIVTVSAEDFERLKTIAPEVNSGAYEYELEPSNDSSK
ncbi:hypothetical protein HKX48_006503 [Thoreauomyces humboldtii]|nr:hypothetical protein HKX48_006503 [Thoreauomyces humboldtii]